MSAFFAPNAPPVAAEALPRVAAPRGGARPHPGFIRTTARILWVLALTGSTLVGGILYQAHRQCPEPCWIDGLTPVEALRGAPKSMPAR
jgi:hypothetical protein